MPQAYWIIPLEAGHIDNSLPGGGHASNRPIYHPGHPSHGLPVPPNYVGGGPIYHPGHPDHGLPSQPGHPSNRPPGKFGGRINNALPDGEPVPPDTINPPLPAYLPEPYDDKVIVAIKRPNVVEWSVTAYDVDSGIDNTLPPAPEPK
jgi:hypothetical protein